jgi:hypothetical protein
MGSSSDIEFVLDPCILIMQSMFFPRVVVPIGDGIFCGSAIFFMVVVHGEVQALCCEQFMLCKGVVGSLLVCNDNASVLVRLKTITQNCITEI